MKLHFFAIDRISISLLSILSIVHQSDNRIQHDCDYTLFSFLQLRCLDFIHEGSLLSRTDFDRSKIHFQST
jgi:hypothetical protein